MLHFGRDQSAELLLISRALHCLDLLHEVLRQMRSGAQVPITKMAG